MRLLCFSHTKLFLGPILRYVYASEEAEDKTLYYDQIEGINQKLV